MSSELQVALGAGFLSGFFALLGVALSNLGARRREDRQFRTNTALELADTERYVWGEDWVELNINLQRQETRLTVAGTPPDLVQALRNMSVFCWREQREGAEIDQPGISNEFLDARRDVSRAIANHLLQTGKESERQQAEREAVENAQRIWDSPHYQRFRDREVPTEPF